MTLKNTLLNQGYTLKETFSFEGITLSEVYEKNEVLIAIDLAAIVDTPFSYARYCQMQNRWMHQSQAFYRILDDDIEMFEGLLENNDYDFHDSQTFNREKYAIDPTPLEYNFEDCFAKVYGTDKFNYLHREHAFTLPNGVTSYIDYALFKDNNKWIAIEANGVSYHHPFIIKRDKYRKMLMKQNAVTATNGKMFRWDTESITKQNSIIDDLKTFLGDIDDYYASSHLYNQRGFKLYDHQDQALESFEKDRAEGIKAALLVLPMGTGKTTIAIEDLTRQCKSSKKNIIVIVPSKELVTHWEDEFDKANIGNAVTTVRTYAYFSRHFRSQSPSEFDIIIVDEAHHAVSPVLSRALQYYTPEFLLGMTATDKRFDKRELSSIFGSYEVKMTLKQAVEQNILCPIRSYRLETGIDLSKIRFNGKDYNSSQLEKNVVVPSRNKLVANVLHEFFYDEIAPKSGIIFCINIKHAQKMAELMREKGFRADYVYGADPRRKEKIEAYMQGKLQFLSTCSLLTEGWNAPHTSIVVMARPTLSKVLYQQQIGRGTRKHPGKEALIVIDVVDNYGNNGSFSNAPWSLHSLFDSLDYAPFGDILNVSRDFEYIDTIHEEAVKLSPFDIFTFEKAYGDYLSTEQVARALFVGTSTIKSWLKKNEIQSDVQIKITRSIMHLFKPERIDEIRALKGLREHSDETIARDFWDFIDKGTYTFSYKMYFIKSMIEVCNDVGVAKVDDILKRYQRFYLERHANNQVIDKPNSPYNRLEMLNDDKKMKENMLANPYEKFERKRFITQSVDLSEVAFNSHLWNDFKSNDGLKRLEAKMNVDLLEYYGKITKSN